MLWLGCSAFLFFLVFNHGHFTGSDEVAIYEMTQSIVARGDLPVVLSLVVIGATLADHIQIISNTIHRGIVPHQSLYHNCLGS